MKKLWKTFNHLVNSAGFGWDKETETVTAEESVWDDYLKVSSS